MLDAWQASENCTETVGKVPYPAYPGYIPGVFHTRVRVGIVGMTSSNMGLLSMAMMRCVQSFSLS